jgi:hypothetical protein
MDLFLWRRKMGVIIFGNSITAIICLYLFALTLTCYGAKETAEEIIE